MDSHLGQWSLSPSGSRAEDQSWKQDATFENFSPQAFGLAMEDVYTYQEEMENYALQSSDAFGASELAPGQKMSVKVPPAWGGSGSWFAFEELVLDWLDIFNLKIDSVIDHRSPFPGNVSVGT